MKLNENFVLREIAGNYVILPLGSASVDLNGMLKLNESGAFLWKVLETGADAEGLVQALTGEYTVSQEQARADVAEFLEKLVQAGCAEA